MKRLFQLFHAPDQGATTGGPTISEAVSTPVEAPDSGSVAAGFTVEDVDLGHSPAEQVTGPIVVGPKEAGFEDGEAEMERMEAHMENRPVRERGPDGKFLPKAKKPEVQKLLDETKPKIDPKAAKPPVKAAPKPAKPAAVVPTKPAVAAPVAAAKVKIGDAEKTADEWAAELADLRAKAESAGKPAAVEAPKKEEPPALKPEEIAKAEAEKFDKFLADRSAQYKMSPQELDDILAGGEKAADTLARVLTKVEAHGRKFAADEINRMVDHFEKKLEPLVARDQRVSEWQRDQSFLEANADIKNHPKGYETYAKVRKDVEDGYDRISKAVAAGTASRVEKAWHVIRENQTPEALESSLAALTKEELAKIPAEASPNAASEAQPKASQRSPNAARPFNGDRPGGNAAPMNGETDQARHVREMGDRW